MGESHIRNSGFLEVAELNNIVMIFPQALSSLPENEIGCWDTYGLTGPLYATQRGGQVSVVRNILARALGQGREVQTFEDQSGVLPSFESQKGISIPVQTTNNLFSNKIYG